MRKRVLLLATALVAAASSAAAQAPGVTDDSIKLGTQAPMSGAMPALSPPGPRWAPR